MTFTLPHKDFGPVCLVTGGAGYVGSTLIRRLLSLGLQVRSVDISPCPVQHENLTVFTGDIADPNLIETAMQGVHTVFHTAAQVCNLKRARQPLYQRVRKTNVEATALLLQAAQAHGVGQFVYTSSNNVCLDREIDGGDENEAYASNHMDIYVETKVEAEKLVLAADSRNGMRTAALRPGGIWGPGEGAIMFVRFIEKLVAGQFVATYGSFASKTDTTHVENLIDAQLLAACKLQDNPDLVGGQAYFINDDLPVNQQLFYKPVVSMLGYQFPRLRLPEFSLMWLAALTEWFHLLFNTSVPVLTVSSLWRGSHPFWFRIDKAKDHLGYHPRYTSHNAMQPIQRDLQALAWRIRRGKRMALHNKTA